jgi:preprotein translocase subunit SecE
MAKIVSYISESFEEVNMTWPEWPEVQRLTLLLLSFLYYSALATWGVDEFLHQH